MVLKPGSFRAGCSLLLALVSGASSAWADGKPVIGVLLKNRVGYWSAVEKGALAAGQDLGAEVVVKGPPSVANPTLQLALLKSLEARKLDALVVSPINPALLEPEVRALAARGTKLVTFDAPGWAGFANISIGSNHEAITAQAVGVFATLVSGHDEVVVLRNNQADLPVVRREELLLQKLHLARPNLVVHSEIFASTVAGEEAERARTALEQYPGVRAVLSTGTAGTMAMLEALKEKGLAGKVRFVGFGTNLNAKAEQAIRSGALDGWVAQLPFDLGYNWIKAAAALVAGRSSDAASEDTSMVVTRANLDDPKVRSLLKL